MEVDLGPLRPEEVLAELVVGRRGEDGTLEDLERVALRPRGPAAGTIHLFEGSWTGARAGSFGCALRVRLRTEGDGPPSFHDPVVWA